MCNVTHFFLLWICVMSYMAQKPHPLTTAATQKKGGLQAGRV